VSSGCFTKAHDELKYTLAICLRECPSLPGHDQACLRIDLGGRTFRGLHRRRHSRFAFVALRATRRARSSAACCSGLITGTCRSLPPFVPRCNAT
jgi:hypothetical protein